MRNHLAIVVVTAALATAAVETSVVPRAAAVVAKPKILGASAAPKVITTSHQTSMIAAFVTGATNCAIAATPAVLSGAGTVACSTGAVSSRLVFPANTAPKKATKYVVTLSATGPGGTQTKKFVLKVNAGAGGQPTTLTGSVAISTGSLNQCILLADTTAVCWGENSAGQLGNGTTTASTLPVHVVGIGGTGYLSGITELSSGPGGTCAVLADTTAACWGANSDGRLGDGTTTGSPLPVHVVGIGGIGTLSGVVHISVGWDHACAVLADTTATCWGYNFWGDLGNGLSGVGTNSAVPVRVVGVGGIGTLTGVSRISAGGDDSCAVLADTTAVCWGKNDHGELGVSPSTQSARPVRVVGIGGVGLLTGITQIATGLYHSCAVLADASAACWGHGGSGRLGSGATPFSSLPVQVVGIGGTDSLTGVAHISVGTDQSCAVLADTTAACWGGNDSGQLGNAHSGAGAGSAAPVAVVGVGGTGTLSGITGLSSGNFITCATLSNTSATCWGHGGNSQLGNGTTTDSNVPVTVVD